MKHKIQFKDFPDMELNHGSELSEYLTASNSPILFGCRTGICGTCLCVVSKVKNGSLDEVSEDEKEILELYAQDPSRGGRLACQIKVTADMTLDNVPSDF